MKFSPKRLVFNLAHSINAAGVCRYFLAETPFGNYEYWKNDEGKLFSVIYAGTGPAEEVEVALAESADDAEEKANINFTVKLMKCMESEK